VGGGGGVGCLGVWVCVSVYIFMHMFCLFVCTHSRTSKTLCARLCVCVRTYVCMNECVCVCVRACICACVRACVRACRRALVCVHASLYECV